MQDPGPFLPGSHKGGYGTVRKDESNQSRQEGRSAQKRAAKELVAFQWIRPRTSTAWRRARRAGRLLGPIGAQGRGRFSPTKQSALTAGPAVRDPKRCILPVHSEHC